MNKATKKVMGKTIAVPGRTILFERFNEERSLFNALNKRGEDFQSNSFTEITNGLCVDSFNDFLEKFQPRVYQTAISNNDGQMYYTYTTNKIAGDESKEVKIEGAAFFKAVQKLLNSKEFAASDNGRINYGLISDLLSPDSQQKKVERLMNEYQYNQRSLNEAIERGADPAEIEEYQNDSLDMRDQIADTYKDSVIALLPLAIKQCDNIIQKLGGENNDTEAPKQITGGRITYDNNGLPKYEMLETKQDVPAEDGDVIDGDDSTLPEHIKALKDDFADEAPEEVRDNPYFLSLIVSAANGNIVLPSDENERAELCQNQIMLRDMYKNIYQKTQESFIQTASDLIEKILGVKAFFDHAQEAGTSSNARLLITNCTISEITENETITEKLDKYLNTLSKNTDERLWFAIIPGVNPAVKKSKHTEMKQESRKYTELAEAKSIIKILQKNSIMSFFSFKGSEKTGFKGVNADTINSYKDTLDSFNSGSDSIAKSSIFCYPNFTVVPENQKNILMGTENGKNIYIKGSGIFIDSCYVACGLFAAFQDPEIMKKRLRSKGAVDTDLPCVRVDFMNYARDYLTKMNRENIYGWTDDIKNAAKDFGFCFCCDEAVDTNGKKIENAYVFSARTLERDDGGNYAPIFRQLTANFIDEYLRLNGENFKSDISLFTENVVKEKWQDKTIKCINRVLLTKEFDSVSSERSGNSVNFKLVLSGGETTLDYSVSASGTESNI